MPPLREDDDDVMQQLQTSVLEYGCDHPEERDDIEDILDGIQVLEKTDWSKASDLAMLLLDDIPTRMESVKLCLEVMDVPALNKRLVRMTRNYPSEEALGDDVVCLGCSRNTATGVFRPCGHMTHCMTCLAQASSTPQCSVCDERVFDVVHCDNNNA